MVPMREPSSPREVITVTLRADFGAEQKHASCRRTFYFALNRSLAHRLSKGKVCRVAARSTPLLAVIYRGEFPALMRA